MDRATGSANINAMSELATESTMMSQSTGGEGGGHDLRRWAQQNVPASHPTTPAGPAKSALDQPAKVSKRADRSKGKAAKKK